MGDNTTHVTTWMSWSIGHTNIIINKAPTSRVSGNLKHCTRKRAQWVHGAPYLRFRDITTVN